MKQILKQMFLHVVILNFTMQFASVKLTQIPFYDVFDKVYALFTTCKSNYEYRSTQNREQRHLECSCLSQFLINVILSWYNFCEYVLPISKDPSSFFHGVSDQNHVFHLFIKSDLTNTCSFHTLTLLMYKMARILYCMSFSSFIYYIRRCVLLLNIKKKIIF